MTKEMRELLNQINNKKTEAKKLVNENKLDEAKALRTEILNLQDKFDVMKDLYDEGEDDMANQVANDEAVVVNSNKEKKPNVVAAFVNAVKAKIFNQPVAEEDRKILNMMTEKDPDENGLSDGGLTVPVDVRTEIIELRRSSNALENLVNVERVSTLSGTRVIEVNADDVPFDNVEEAAEFPEVATPKLEQIKYKVKKKGGILKVTYELLQDSAENIMAYLRKWIAKKARATRNALILKALNDHFGTDPINITNFDDFKDLFNVGLDPAIAQNAQIVTNQDGFNWLDKLKDIDGRYVMQPDPMDKTRMLLFGKYPLVVIKNKVMPSAGGVAPIFAGDFKEAITLFDRETLTIEISTVAGDLWNRDLTGIKVRERLDIQPVDTEAVVKGLINTTP